MKAMAWKEHLCFLSEFARRPRVVGALAPSSRHLARKIVQGIDWTAVGTVVEYGPGTGVFTEMILAKMRPGTRLIGIEISQRFIDILDRRFPELRVYHDSVKNVQAVCRGEAIEQVDAIVSGLPWATFSEQDQDDFLEATLAVLKPGGQFTTFAYLQGLLLPAARRFKRKLRRHFAKVECREIAWGNIPPAMIYRCRPTELAAKSKLA
jgi:phospholipid N-methyltransferase